MRLPAIALLTLIGFARLTAFATQGAEELPPNLGTRAAGVDWPDFLGPQRNSRSPETGVPDGLAGPLRVVWQCELGASYGAPSISRGRLVHFDRVGDVHRVTCRNSETGAKLWSYDIPADYVDMLGYNNGPRCTPVIDGDRVYVVSPEGRMHCVRLADGEQVWGVETIREFGIVKNFFGVGSTPIVWSDLLIANIGGSPPGSPPDVYAAAGRVQGYGTGIVAFDKLTGKVRWQATDELASYASPVVADVNGRPHCFVFARGGLVVLDPRNGAVDFQFPWRSPKLESVNASSPVVVDDRVLISEGYGPGGALLRVKSPTPDVIWRDDERGRNKALELHWNTAVYHEGHVYASSGQHASGAELRCVEWATGEVKWREPGLGRSSLLYVDGRLICLSEDGALRLLRATPEGYEVLADLTPTVAEFLRNSTPSESRRDSPTLAESRRDADPGFGETGQQEPLLDYPAWAAPVLSHGLLYVRGASRLVCLELIPLTSAAQ